MNKILEFSYNFVLLFLIVYIIYRVFINKKKKDFSKLKKSDEVYIFVKRYNINVKKINYNKLLRVMAFNNSFIIAFTSTIIINIDSIIWSILICFVVVFILLYSLYEIAGRYFKKMEGKKNV